MRVILVQLAILISIASLAQKKKLPPPPPPPGIEAYKCVYTMRFSDSARLRFYPFNRYPIVKMVSFLYHGKSSPIRKNSVVVDSLVENVILSPKDIDELTDVLYNNYIKGDVPPQESLCTFTPRNALLFFDSKNRLAESVIICFHCDDFKKSNERVNLGDDCTEKLEKLRQVFISKGVKFGTDLSENRFPGETGFCCE